MRVAIFHGFELTGSGSNEYTRYLSRALARQGHDVHVLCREPDPASIPRTWRALLPGTARERTDGSSRADAGEEGVTLHQLANGAVRPVYVTDKQRAGNVKAFESLTAWMSSRMRAINAAGSPVVRATSVIWPRGNWRDGT